MGMTRPRRGHPLCTRSKVIVGDTHPHRRHAYTPPCAGRRLRCVFRCNSWRSIAQPAANAVKATCGLRSAFIPPAATQCLWKRLATARQRSGCGQALLLIASPREHNRSTGPQARRLGSQIKEAASPPFFMVLPDRRVLDSATGCAEDAPELHLNKNTSSPRRRPAGGVSKL